VLFEDVPQAGEEMIIPPQVAIRSDPVAEVSELVAKKDVA
jgi:hypothetical protein